MTAVDDKELGHVELCHTWTFSEDLSYAVDECTCLGTFFANDLFQAPTVPYQQEIANSTMSGFRPHITAKRQSLGRHCYLKKRTLGPPQLFLCS